MKIILEELKGKSSSQAVDYVIKASEVGTEHESDEGLVIEGVFDGQHMIGPDGKKYSVPANYASKSKLVEGDILKLTIDRQGNFIYKQIGLYAFRRPFLRQFVQMEQTDLELVEGIEFLRLIENGYRVRTVISNYNPISVDTISDLKEVEKIMAKDKSFLTY